MTSLGEQTWFRADDRALEGWVHRPDDGRAVGAVVIAGPFAYEKLVAYRALRVLAVRAARRGLVAVRFSWSGTGDSEPAPDDVPLAEAWERDLEAAIDLARSASGIEDVDAIGVRFGAAVVDAGGVPLRRRVLWEPVGGRAFLRMQSSLLTLHLPEGFPRAERGVELCGELLDEDAAASLRAIPDPRRAVASGDPDADRVILEEDPQISAALFGGSPQEARVPSASIDRVLDALAPGPATALPRWTPEREVISVDPASGRRIRQTLLGIGPHVLPGILTEPIDGAPAPEAAVFIPFGNQPKGGHRICRATSFHLAAAGIVTLRADRRGRGDAADPDVLEEVRAYDGGTAQDIAGLATWLADRTGRPVAGIGLCSGAWLVARAAALGPFRRLVMVNNGMWTVSPRLGIRLENGFGVRPVSPVLDVEGGPAIGNATEQGLRGRIGSALRLRAPYRVRYRVYSALGLEAIAESVLRAIPPTTAVTLLIGDAGDRRRWEESRGSESIRRLTQQGRSIEVAFDRRTDHSLMSAAAFDSYFELLDREFGTRSPVVESAE